MVVAYVLNRLASEFHLLILLFDRTCKGLVVRLASDLFLGPVFDLSTRMASSLDFELCFGR